MRDDPTHSELRVAQAVAQRDLDERFPGQGKRCEIEGDALAAREQGDAVGKLEDEGGAGRGTGLSPLGEALRRAQGVTLCVDCAGLLGGGYDCPEVGHRPDCPRVAPPHEHSRRDCWCRPRVEMIDGGPYALVMHRDPGETDD